MNEQFWSPSFLECDLEKGHGLKPEDFASYAYPPGERKRYTDDGWEKLMAIVSEVEVTPALQFHRVGCVKRYGAEGAAMCECERRLADSAPE